MSEGALAFTQALRSGLTLEEALVVGRGEDLMRAYREQIEELLDENEEMGEMLEKAACELARLGCEQRREA